MIGIIWTAGFVLFCKHSIISDTTDLTKPSVNTNPDIVYIPDATYSMTSGVGVFNSSLVQPSLNEWNHSVPYGLYAQLYNFVVNTEISVQGPAISCLDESNCNSYLLPGSLSTSAPWPPGGSPESPVVAIWNAPAVQYEFRNSIDGPDYFSQSDCDVIGGGPFILAVQVCIAQSNAYPGSLILGKSYSAHRNALTTNITASALPLLERNQRFKSMPQSGTDSQHKRDSFHLQATCKHDKCPC
jgi:hypothetical protein